MTRSARTIAASLAVSLICATPLHAHAEAPGAPPAGSPGPSSDHARGIAEARLNEGLALYGKGDYEGARLAFTQAYSVLNSVQLLHNLARAEFKSGHPLEAILHLKQILRDPRADEADRQKAARLLADANKVVGHVAIDGPVGASITLDKVPSGEAPFTEPFDVSAGRHVVEARLGARMRIVEINAPAGEVVTARFTADELAAPPEPAAPASAPPAVVVAPASPSSIGEDVPATHRASKARTITTVGLGVGALAAVGVGVGFAIASGSSSDDMKAARAAIPGGASDGACVGSSDPACQRLADAADAHTQSSNLATGFFIAGGALAVAAVATYALWPNRTQPPRPPR